MAVGNVITLTEFNRVIGHVCKSMENLAIAVEDANAIFRGKTAEDWSEELGLSVSDVNNALSAMLDMEQLINIYQGETALASPKDFRVFVRRCRGLSSVI